MGRGRRRLQCASGIKVGVDDRNGIILFLPILHQSGSGKDVPMHGEDIRFAPAHPSEFGLLESLHVAGISDDMGSHDDEQFGPIFVEVVVAEEVLENRNVP